MEHFFQLAHYHALQGDVDAMRKARRDFRRRTFEQRRRQREVDQDQDERIAALEREVDELKFGMAALVGHLVVKGLMQEIECLELGEDLEAEE